MKKFKKILALIGGVALATVALAWTWGHMTRVASGATETGETLGGMFYPSVSDDGNSIAFLQWNGSDTDVYL